MSDDIELLRRFYLHSPADVAQSYAFWAERLRTEQGITFGCVLDQYMIPLHPGDLMAVVARPGHGKSSFMAYMTKREAEAIIARGRQDTECVIYISWEQTIEEVEAFYQSGPDYSSTDLARGKVPMETILRKLVKRAGLPIWYIGNSQRHARFRKPDRLTAEVVYQMIDSLYAEYQLSPTLICMDYLQLMPVKSGTSRVEAVTEATFQAKELAMNTGVPIIVGVQANRDVDDQKYQIPSLSSAQWASAIEQAADKQLGLWRPRKTHDPIDHPTIRVGGVDYTNDEDLFVVKILKQRFERGFGAMAIRFKPQTLEVHDYETRNIQL